VTACITANSECGEDAKVNFRIPRSKKHEFTKSFQAQQSAVLYMNNFSLPLQLLIAALGKLPSVTFAFQTNNQCLKLEGMVP
jgi:hypothetical protein